MNENRAVLRRASKSENGYNALIAPERLKEINWVPGNCDCFCLFTGLVGAKNDDDEDLHNSKVTQRGQLGPSQL